MRQNYLIQFPLFNGDIESMKRVTVEMLKLYKYLGINPDSLDGIASSQVWMSCPEFFNDPLDARIRFSSHDDASYRAHCIDILRAKNEEGSTYESAIFVLENNVRLAFSDVNRFLLSHELLTSDEVKKCIRSFHLRQPAIFCNSLYNRLGISCFTKTNTNSLMWAHYANGHKGICVGYLLSEEDYSLLVGNSLFEVQYGAKPDAPISGSPKFSEDEILKSFKRMITLKSAEWLYEKEWRYVVKDKAGKLYRAPGKISDVTFGLKVSREDRVKVINSLSNLDLKYFRVYEEIDSFVFGIAPH